MQAVGVRPFRAAWIGVLCLFSVACAGPEVPAPIKAAATAPAAEPTIPRLILAASRPADHSMQSALLQARIEAVPERTDWQCVPYAREISGIAIRGNAWTWWDQAEGRYERGSKPQIGAVLVLRRSGSMRLGHVAVVTSIVGPREIIVSHANWGNSRGTRGRVDLDTRVIDVSPDNDWSQTRFWWEPTDAFGRIYPAYGFIYPDSGPGIMVASAEPTARR